MAGSAQVRSVEAIARFRAALIQFRERVQGSLEGLDGQMRRAIDWIEHNQPSYWKQAVRAAEDAVHHARIDLERCLAFPPISGEHPSCREEKATLADARARLDYCRGQRERVKNWQRTIDHEVFEYQGRLSSLRSLLESDLVMAEGDLARIIRRLDEYMIEQAPLTQPNELPPVLGDAPPDAKD